MDYCAGQHGAQGRQPRGLLLHDDRPLRHVGDRIRLQAAVAAAPKAKTAELKKIAARSGEPALAYATDEDTRGIDPDPLSNRFDLGKDPIAYAKAAGTN